ncbi:MAG: dihydroneopterin aldolase [Bacteroidota bacterium]
MSKHSSLTRLTISNAVYFGYHGVRDEEQVLGGKYEVDVDMYYDSTRAVVSDDVGDALNYEEAVFMIGEIINSDPYNLVETIVHEILDSLMDKFPKLMSATVRVRKHAVPVRQYIDYIEVEQSMTREEMDKNALNN